MRLPMLAAVLGLSLLGCRGSDDPMNMGDDAPPIDAPPGSTEVKIQDVQGTAVADGDLVRLEGVIVTAVDVYGARTGEFFVQEPEGGEYSGVKVFGAPLDVVSTLQVGDIVNISNAVKDEYRYEGNGMGGGGFPEGYSLTELVAPMGGAMTVIKTGTGTPVATDVDALAIDMLPTFEERDAQWEKWEGVLISVKKARQTTEVASFGMGEDQKSFKTTGSLEVQSALTDIGTPAIDTCFASLVGVGDYFFSYKLAPRSAADLVAGGTDCATVVTQDATIAEVQAGTKTGMVNLGEVYVTGISFNKRHLWVSQTLNAAPNEGIYVFRGSSAATLPAEITIGAKVSVRGTAVENNNDMTGDTVTQIAGGIVMFVEAKTADPTPVTGVTAATLTQAATGEPYEGVLVTLNNVKVTKTGDSAGFYVGELVQGGTTFLSDDDVLRWQAADLNKCFATVTGIWSYQVFSNAYALLPITATGTGTCP